MEPAKVIDGEVDKPKKNGKRLAVVEPIAPPTTDPWLATVERLAPAVGIEGIRELMTLRREEMANQAAQAFNAAMSAAQADLVPVARNQRNKQTSSNYADLAAISEQAMPIIHRNGFNVICSEFKSELPEHIGIACKVGHSGGHSERYEFNVPFDGKGMKGNANKTDTHAYGSTVTYGRRYAVCCVFNIATKDDDGNAAGGSAAPAPVERITAEQVDALNARIQKTKTPSATAAIILQHFKRESLGDLTPAEHEATSRKLKEHHGV